MGLKSSLIFALTMLRTAALAIMLVFCSISFGQQQAIKNFKPWSIAEGQRLDFTTDKISFEFSPRIDYGLKDFDFVDDLRGYAVGIGAVVGQYPIFYSTIDGGQHWARRPLRKGWNPTGIAFRNSNEGIITTHDVSGCPPPNCLNKTITLNTQDGGKSWQLIEHKELRGLIANPVTDNIGNYYAAVVLYDYKINPSSYVLTTKLVKSVDGGFTWDVIYEFGHDEYNAQSFHLVGDMLFVPSGNSAIAKLSTSGDLLGRIELKVESLQQFIAVSNDVLFAVAYFDNTTAQVMRTTNGGQSWDIIRRDWAQLVTAKSPDELIVVVTKGTQPGPVDMAGGVSAVAYTVDGGQSWLESEMVATFYSHILWHSETSNRVLILLNDRIASVTTRLGEHLE